MWRWAPWTRDRLVFIDYLLFIRHWLAVISFQPSSLVLVGFRPLCLLMVSFTAVFWWGFGLLSARLNRKLSWRVTVTSRLFAHILCSGFFCGSLMNFQESRLLRGAGGPRARLRPDWIMVWTLIHRDGHTDWGWGDWWVLDFGQVDSDSESFSGCRL